MHITRHVYYIHFSFFRTSGLFKPLGMSDFTQTNLQILGSEQTYGPHADPNLVSKPYLYVIYLHVF